MLQKINSHFRVSLVPLQTLKPLQNRLNAWQHGLFRFPPPHFFAPVAFYQVTTTPEWASVVWELVLGLGLGVGGVACCIWARSCFVKLQSSKRKQWSRTNNRSYYFQVCSVFSFVSQARHSPHGDEAPWFPSLSKNTLIRTVL